MEWRVQIMMLYFIKRARNCTTKSTRTSQVRITVSRYYVCDVWVEVEVEVLPSIRACPSGGEFFLHDVWRGQLSIRGMALTSLASRSTDDVHSTHRYYIRIFLNFSIFYRITCRVHGDHKRVSCCRRLRSPGLVVVICAQALRRFQ